MSRSTTPAMKEQALDLDAEARRLGPDGFAAFGHDLAERAWPVFHGFMPEVPFGFFRDHSLMLGEQGLERRRVSLFTDKQSGAVVGFATLRAIELDVDGERHLVMTGGCYILEDYRGQGLATRFFMRHAFAVLARALRTRRRPWLFTLCGPATYHMTCKRCPEVYPSPGSDMTPAIGEVYARSKAGFGYTSLPGRPYVIGDGTMWRREEAPHITRRWRSRTEPHVKYFLEVCGDYLDGRGLMAIVPFTAGNLGSLVAGVIRDSLGGLLPRRRRAAQIEKPVSTSSL